MTVLPILTFDEAVEVGESLHDRWIGLTGETPIPRDSFGWADIVQFVTIKACERVIDRASNDDEAR